MRPKSFSSHFDTGLPSRKTSPRCGIQTPDNILPKLVLPHPRMQDRAFVLVPLADVAPDWVHPVLRRTATQLRDSLPPAELEGVTRIENGWE